MSDERDELVKLIAEADGSGHFLRNGRNFAYGPLADAILAAGYRRPRQVTTVEELDALPVGSVVRTAGTDTDDPRVAVKDGMWKSESEWFVADSSEWCLDSTELDDLPATVLHIGGSND
ncbi:hypothetical protein AB0N33_00910 [Pseudarthrobacter oxydans]|uniref:hypothetical protein n=1 Tax=Pseudarthrobacter oxydans TaxID=1671 RepID=UPI0034375461